jgi:F0F1-type ATP synthase membrane subunit b/b'
MTIIPDFYLSVLMTVPFFITFFALKVLLFHPFFDYLEARSNASATAKAEAAQISKDVAAQMLDVEKRLSEARSTVAAARKDARASAALKESEILAIAKETADTKLQAALATINEAQALAQANLKDLATTLSTEITGAVLTEH